MVLIIIVAAIGIWLLPGDESGVTGAAVGVKAAASSGCPTGEDLETLNQCKTWKESGKKTGDLVEIPNDLITTFCNKFLDMYPKC